MRSLGLEVGKRDIGGVAFSGGSSALFRANLWLRTATRVIARVGDFHARLFDELERHARKLAWGRFIDGGQPVRLRVSTSKSRLYHTGAVAQRIAEAMEKSTGIAPTVTSGGDDDDESGDTPLVIVRLFRDQCTVSIDIVGCAVAPPRLPARDRQGSAARDARRRAATRERMGSAHAAGRPALRRGHDSDRGRAHRAPHAAGAQSRSSRSCSGRASTSPRGRRCSTRRGRRSSPPRPRPSSAPIATPARSPPRARTPNARAWQRTSRSRRR